MQSRAITYKLQIIIIFFCYLIPHRGKDWHSPPSLPPDNATYLMITCVPSLGATSEHAAYPPPSSCLTKHMNTFSYCEEVFSDDQITVLRC